MTSGATFGEVLRYLRKRAGLTQGALAAAVGCSGSYISALETGQRRPDAALVRTRLAPALAKAESASLVDRLLELATAADTRSAEHDPGPPRTADRYDGATPAASDGLFGRDTDIAALCQRLMNHPGRLLTLVGPPGVGKTSLAQAVAHVLAPFHADGAHAVWLDAVRDSALMGAAVATALGIPEDNRAPTARIVDQLRNREVLLLLDNFDDFARDPSATALVANLLKACPRLRILVTSRTRLKLRAEQSVQVKPLDRSAAVELFVARMRNHQPGYAPTPAQLEAIAEICRLLDDLPLAMELIAAHAPEVTMQDLLEHVRADRLALLGQRAPKLSSAQRTLTAALQHSYALLAPAEQRALRLLSVFDGGAGVDGAAAMAIDLSVVQALADKSLLRLESGGEVRRLRLLETVREYAAMLLTAAGESADAQQRRLAWCLALAEEAAALLHGAGQTGWLQRLEPERYNFFAAIQYGLSTGAVEATIRVVVALRHFWVARNHLTEIVPWFDLIEHEAAVTAIDHSLRARFLNCRGTLAFYLTQYDLAGAYFLAALDLAAAIGDRQELAYALDGLGAQAVNCGQLHLARTYSTASLEHASAIGDHWLAGISLMNLGEIARMEDDIAAAAAHYRASLSRLQRAGDPYFVAVAEINLGQVYLLQGDYARAESVLRQALAAGLQAESAQVVTSALEKLAGALYGRDSSAAVRLFSLARALRQVSGVAVQPVDQADYADLAARVQQAAAPAVAPPPIADGLHLDWRAVHAAIAITLVSQPTEAARWLP